MSPDEAEFRDLMERIQNRDNAAAARLLRLYGDTVLFFVRRYLNRFRGLRTQFDSDDLGQIVWTEFFTSPDAHEKFTTPAQFTAYLLGIARHQVSKAARAHLDTEKRDLRRHRHLSDPSVSDKAAAVVDSAPSPARRSELLNSWEDWLHSLTSEQQSLVLMRFAGFSNAEIAHEFGCCERTVERMVSDLRRNPPPAPVTNL